MKRTLPCFLVSLMSWTLPGPAQAAAANQARKPNIIVVITDDQGFGDLGCHGHRYLKPPNLDRLHAQSTRLTDFHVSPTCSPTRAALMTGRAPFKNGITQDIGEKNNVIKQHPEVAGKMLAAYDQWWTEVRPFMVNEDVPLAKERPSHAAFGKQQAEKGIPAWTAPDLERVRE